MTILAFAGSPDGAEPKGSLTLVGSTLYGRTAIGGSTAGSGANCGTIFSLDTSGANYQVLYRFNGPDGCDPRHDAPIVLNNFVYATTQGVNQQTSATYGNAGQIFDFPVSTPPSPIASPIATVHVFAGSPDGAQQHSSFSVDPVTGFLIGATAKGGANNTGMLYAVDPGAKTFVGLHDFVAPEGTEPHGRAVLINGIVYIITRTAGSCGGGSILSFTIPHPYASVSPQVLHQFCGGSSDGFLSDHGYLTLIGSTLYGMTQCGGSGSTDTSAGADCNSSSGGGRGVLFGISPNGGNFRILHSFLGKDNASGGDGAYPYGSLFYDGSTWLYGTTRKGGDKSADGGTIFRFNPATAEYDVVYQFGKKASDGANPIDNVIIANGMLYGMTVAGGSTAACPSDASTTGCGTVFAVPVPP